ncbi:MAG: hypothetical protein FJY56_12350 [Betaproteobacteria bacterium]|nr:hypothetical protein [Betaproteobacteria bacterium]
MLDKADYDRLGNHIAALGIPFLSKPSLRFVKSAHEHDTFMIADPSGNVVEFKCYVQPENSY